MLCRKHLSSTKVGQKAIRARVAEYFKEQQIRFAFLIILL
jgi:hypothetical protein